MRNANVLLTGEVTGKNVTATVKVLKKDEFITLSHGYPYILSYEMEVASLFNTSLVSGSKVFELYFPEQGCQRC